MDQEAEAMKNKKALWPWAKRMVMGETKASRRHTAGSKNTDAGLGMIQNLPMILTPLRSMNGSTPSCA